MVSFMHRAAKAWNVFLDRDNSDSQSKKLTEVVYNSYSSSNRIRNNFGDASIINTILTRIAVDVCSVEFRHVRIDQNGRLESEIGSYLNECLSFNPNVDQTPEELMRDLVLTIFEEGVAALVPVETDLNLNSSNTFDVRQLRVGRIKRFYTHEVELEVYDELSGMYRNVTLSKKSVALIYNPFYEIMNKPNSTLARLSRKLALLDSVDEASSSGKLDLIIQLPYVVKSEERKRQAETRRKSIEDQLRNGTYGIAYTDGTERITQLNRPAENNLLGQIKYLTEELYNRLGITHSVFDGTASEQTMTNYINRTVVPVQTAIIAAMNKSFLTKTARTQRQRIIYIRDPFKFVPTSSLGTMADSFLRNEILTSNEFRAILGYSPVTDPNADQLRNANINPVDKTPNIEVTTLENPDEKKEEVLNE